MTSNFARSLYNTSKTPIRALVAIDPKSIAFTTLAGQCTPEAAAPGSVTVTLPAFGYAVCAAK